MPVVKNNRQCCGKPRRSAKYSAMSPMAKEPNTLIIIVPSGNPVPNSRAAARLNAVA